MENNSNTIPVDIYEGEDGRRQAVMRFLKLAIQTKEPMELMLTSQEDMTWLTGNTEFLKEWNKLLMQVILVGHSITIIHSFDRSLTSISSIINYWLPLHLTGKVKSYCYTRYTDQAPKQTLFIVKNKVCILGQSPGNGGDRMITMCFQDQIIAQTYEESFLFLMKKASPLFDYISRDRTEMVEISNELVERRGDTYLLVHEIPEQLISSVLLQKILVKMGMDRETIKRTIEVHKLEQKALFENLVLYKMCITLVLDFDKGVEVLLLTGGDALRVPLTKEECTEAMADMMQMEQTIELLQLNFIGQQDPSGIIPQYDYLYKEGEAVIVIGYPNHSEQPVMLQSSEKMLLNAFKVYYENIEDYLEKVGTNVEQLIVSSVSTESTSGVRLPYGDFGLTHKEVEVINLLTEGLKARDIAIQLGISVNTVKCHTTSIYRKAGVTNRFELLHKLSRSDSFLS